VRPGEGWQQLALEELQQVAQQEEPGVLHVVGDQEYPIATISKWTSTHPRRHIAH
jgi:hypothetical protein